MILWQVFDSLVSAVMNEYPMDKGRIVTCQKPAIKLTLFKDIWRQYGRNDLESKCEEVASMKPNRIRYLLVFLSGANSRDRTDDLRITNALLYQLSYVGFLGDKTR